MEIKQVKIKNFRGYGINKNSCDGYFTFDNLNDYDLVVLSGYNGYGKTSFYDAIEWCLTDRIQRLVELDDIFNLGKTYLKKSEYLKFNGTELNKGKAEVAITFVHDKQIYYIKRVTFSNSFQDLNYKSDCYDQYDDLMTKDDCEQIINLINNSNGVSEEGSKYKIKSNILGQERMNEFLRLTKPGLRTQAIFNLVGFNIITELVELSQGSKLNSIKSLLKEMNKHKVEFESCKSDIEKWFLAKGFSGICDYVNETEKEIIEINENLKKISDRYQNFDFVYIINENTILKTVDYYSAFNERIIKYKNDIKTKVQGTLKNWYIKRLDYINGKLNKINFILNYDINEANKSLLEKEKNLKELVKQYDQYYANSVEMRNFNSIASKENFIFKYNESYTEVIDFSFLRDLFFKVNQFYMKFSSINQQSILKYKNKIDEIIKVNWNNQIEEINFKINEIAIIVKEINNEKLSVKALSTNNLEYNNLLVKIKGFIIRENLEHCPICKNDTFDKVIIDNEILKNSKNAQILHIIDNTISQGNKNIYNVQSSINEKEKELKVKKDELSQIIKQTTDCLYDIREFIYKDYNNLSLYISQQIDSISLQINNHNEHITKMRNELKDYKCFNEEIRKDCDVSKIEKERAIQKSYEMYFNLKEYYIKKLKDKYGVVNTLDDEIKSMSNVIEDNEDLKSLIQKLNQCYKIEKAFVNLSRYKMQDDDKRKYNIYIQLKNKITQLNSLYDRLNKKVTNYDSIGRNMKKIETKLIKVLVEDNPLAVWIYKQINPHPIFKNFKFKIDGADTNIVYGGNDNIFLDHIFSSAQLNVLALSIFLGFSLMPGSSNLNQIFLDDPIQNMDDYNVLSVIDIFRALSYKNINRKIIISTHDDNFKNLLAIKFRNKKCKIFDFVEYDNFGPIINDID